MPFVPAICTQCGAQLEVDNTKDAAICQYCGTPFVVEKAINKYNITNNINAKVVNIYNGNNSDFEIVAGVLKKYKGSAVDVVIPEGVVEICDTGYCWDGVFKDCKYIKSLQLPKTLRKIGTGAFYNCESLETIQIPDTVADIGKNAFHGCKNLKSIILPNSLNTIQPELFNGCSALEYIDISSSVKLIFFDAFRGCSSLKSIHIPDSVTQILSDISCNCSSLREITYPSNLSAECFNGTLWYDNYKQDICNGICPTCKTKLTFFGNKCKKCGKKYEIK